MQTTINEPIFYSDTEIELYVKERLNQRNDISAERKKEILDKIHLKHNNGSTTQNKKTMVQRVGEFLFNSINVFLVYSISKLIVMTATDKSTAQQRTIMDNITLLALHFIILIINYGIKLIGQQHMYVKLEQTDTPTLMEAGAQICQKFDIDRAIFASATKFVSSSIASDPEYLVMIAERCTFARRTFEGNFFFGGKVSHINLITVEMFL